MAVMTGRPKQRLQRHRADAEVYVPAPRGGSENGLPRVSIVADEGPRRQLQLVPMRRRRDVPAVLKSNFLRSLVVPAGVITVCAGLVMAIGPPRPNPPNEGPIVRADGKQLMELVAKDAHYHIIPAARGGATGTVWFSPRGGQLSLELSAAGLSPRLHYVAVVVVNGTAYPFARLTADSLGRIALDTALTRFSGDACAVGTAKRSRALDGQHLIKFWVRRDGASAGGGPCAGNGDGDERQVLFEKTTERFVGEPATAGVAR